jgi:hypothetical protein
MEFTDEPENMVATDILDVGESALAGPESLKEGLRRQRQEATQTTHLDLPLPEYNNPELVGRYRMVDPTELGKMGEKLRREFKDRTELVIFGAIDSIIMCCDGLYARMLGETELIPLDPEVPMRYDLRLAEYLDVPAKTARDVVIQCFGHNMFAIIDHNIKITRWMGNRTTDVAGDFLGEL